MSTRKTIAPPKGHPALASDPEWHEDLLGTLTAAMRIRTRPQFYLWSQGEMQRFLPHRTLVCALGDLDRLHLRHEIFSSESFQARVERALTDSASGLLPRALVAWRDRCDSVLHSRSEAVDSTTLEGIARSGDARRVEAGFKPWAAHGTRAIHGDGGSFFLLLQQPAHDDPRTDGLFDLFVPYLHLALTRVLGADAAEAPPTTERRVRLSRRELEVLRWVRDGKTNDEIALILGLRTPTVKNHVQKLLRKLGASNRAQAVGRAAALGLVLASS